MLLFILIGRFLYRNSKHSNLTRLRLFSSLYPHLSYTDLTLNTLSKKQVGTYTEIPPSCENCHIVFLSLDNSRSFLDRSVFSPSCENVAVKCDCDWRDDLVQTLRAPDLLAKQEVTPSLLFRMRNNHSDSAV